MSHRKYNGQIYGSQDGPKIAFQDGPYTLARVDSENAAEGHLERHWDFGP
jgi:hypothetical protein